MVMHGLFRGIDIWNKTQASHVITSREGHLIGGKSRDVSAS